MQWWSAQRLFWAKSDALEHDLFKIFVPRRPNEGIARGNDNTSLCCCRPPVLVAGANCNCCKRTKPILVAHDNANEGGRHPKHQRCLHLEVIALALAQFMRQKGGCNEAAASHAERHFAAHLATVPNGASLVQICIHSFATQALQKHLTRGAAP